MTRKILGLLVFATLSVGLVHAQGVTTGALEGVITDPNGEPLPGVTVVATLTATGNTFTSVSDADGRFRMRNVKVGGPYEVRGTIPGFQDQMWTEVNVRLGETTHLAGVMRLEAATEEIVVVADYNPLINPTRAGVASSVSQGTIEAMPSVDRNIYDFARTNPVFSTYSPDEDATVLSVSGRNPRYNNISIDGSVNNDVFGLADSGTPGGQTETQPIQLDAVQELQLVTSSFDVRQGQFTGGSVNVITRSGTNEWHGGVFYYTSDDGFVGDGPEGLGELGTFEDTEYGFSLGGKIIQDKLHFFVNYGKNELNRPTGWSLDGSGGQAWQGGNFVNEAEEFRAFTQAAYGYDPGGLGQVTRETPNDKIFARIDWTINPSNTLMARYNYVDGSNIINRPDDDDYEWPSEAYDIAIETNSFVTQWNAVFGDNKFNELRFTFQTIRGPRSGVTEPFPHIEIINVDGDFNGWQAGTEQFSTYNGLDQDILEFTNDFTFFTGKHDIVIGTHNEFYKFNNLFIQDGFGSYEFFDLDAYYSGIAEQYDYTYANDPDSPADEFNAYQLGLYAGDTWRVKSNVSLIFGLRLDVPFFPDSPGFNELAFDTYGVDTTEVPSGNILWSPRIGFNWDIRNDATMQLRGGAGLFSGRVPYVWMSNNYARTGLTQTTIAASGDIPFNPDPFDQPTDIGGASTQEINVVDPNFDFPQTWRANLAFDYRMPWSDLVLTLEGMWARSTNEINYKNLNIVQTGEELPFDDRPLYETFSSDFSGAYWLTNTDEGQAANYIVRLEKPYGNYPLWGSVSYAYGDAEVVNDGTSSRAVSNWQYTEAFDPNNVGLSQSDFSVKHRATININLEINRNKRYSTVFSLFWNHQAGRPFSNIYSFAYPSINEDNYPLNDLIYVPSGPDDVVIENGTWEQLENYLNSVGLGGYKGKVAPRNASLQPYITQTDLSIRQNIPLPGWSSFQLTFDIFNLWNLIDRDSGVVRYVPFGTIDPVRYEGMNEDGLPIYELRSEVTGDGDNYWRTDSLRSRWKARFGIRWSF